MAVGSLITATRFNQIQSSVNSVFGVGSENFGYGQSLTSSTVSTTEKVTAEHINKLRKDILSIFVHQRGSSQGFLSKIFDATTSVNPSTNTFTITNHELFTGQKVRYNSGSTGNSPNPVIPGLVNNQTYLIERIDQDQFILKTVPTESFPNSITVNIQGTSTGNHIFFTNLIKELSELVDNSDYVSYSNLSSILSTNRNLFTTTALTNNFTLESNRIISSRNTPWGGGGQVQSVFHEVRVQFASANARRHFFNAGSEIRFEATLTNFPGGDGLAKFNNWAGMFAGMGTISFKALTTSNTGSGTASAIGNFDLTSSYQQIFKKEGTGIYSDNNYIIKARAVDTRTIQFLIEFNDLDQGSNSGPGGFGPVDEPVEGILTSRVHQLRATGNTITENITPVVVQTPTYQNIKIV